MIVNIESIPEAKRERAAVIHASMTGLLEKGEFNRLLHGLPAPKRIQAWCPLSTVGFQCEIESYPDDAACECGEYHHHVHCTHGYIIQTG